MSRYYNKHRQLRCICTVIKLNCVNTTNNLKNNNNEFPYRFNRCTVFYLIHHIQHFVLHKLQSNMVL